jgi:hypothetical protein
VRVYQCPAVKDKEVIIEDAAFYVEYCRLNHVTSRRIVLVNSGETRTEVRYAK